MKELDSIQNVKNNLNAFLEKPFNLYKFHKKCSGNSGGSSYKKDFFRPSGPGMYWNFYYPIEKYYIINRDSFRTFYSYGWHSHISAFHPKDKYMNNQANPNATLVRYQASMNMIEIPELAFIGQRVNKIMNKLGEPNRNLDSILIYHRENNVLFLKQRHQRITGVEYRKLNFKVDSLTELPYRLYQNIEASGG